MRILLVEDDPTTSRSIELMLSHANLNTYSTDSGRRGSISPSSTTTT
jgi:two-component system cell cycle response regulator CtrA